MTPRLSFHNAKLSATARYFGLKNNQAASFNLPSGQAHICVAADLCRWFTDRESGRMTAGPNAQFKCYAAKVESYAPSARKMFWANYDALVEQGVNNKEFMVETLSTMLYENPKVRILRIHAGGEFFSKAYFQAWVEVARNFSNVSFFGYSKVLNYVMSERSENFGLHYSYGGKMDKLWQHYTDSGVHIPTSFVVKPEDARPAPEICTDHKDDADYAKDFMYIMERRSFSLLVH
jgi:hypothetical protein